MGLSSICKARGWNQWPVKHRCKPVDWYLSKLTFNKWRTLLGLWAPLSLIYKGRASLLYHGWQASAWPTKRAVNFQSGMCPVSSITPEIYEMYNLHLSTRCRTAELHVTHRNTYSGMLLSICLSSRRLIGNMRLPWCYIHCVCSWFNRIPQLSPMYL